MAWVIVVLICVVGALVSFIFLRKTGKEIVLEQDNKEIKKKIKETDKIIKKRKDNLNEIKKKISKNTNGMSASDYADLIFFGRKKNK